MERLGVPTHANGTSGVDGAAASAWIAVVRASSSRLASVASKVSAPNSSASMSEARPRVGERVIVGGLRPGEEKLALTLCRLKKRTPRNARPADPPPDQPPRA